MLERWDKMKVVDGNLACASMAYNFSDMCFIYPITPSSVMASQIDLLSSKKLNIFDDSVKTIQMQSEAGAAGAMHGALNAGVLASTFTASQGLLLMIPNMYKMAGEMLPGVIHVAARSLATHALSIFGDHQDIYATRGTGFCILASTNVQDAYNLALVAHLSAIKASLPFLHFFDGFRTSHEYNQINEIAEDKIKELIDYDAVKKFRNRALNSGKAITKGTAQNEDVYFQFAEAKNKDYDLTADIVNDYMKKINKITKENYKPFNYYGSKNASKIIVAMGSVCDTIKTVIDLCDNKDYGLVEVHLYRPFSEKYLKNVIPSTAKKMAVLDRSKEAGSLGEPLYLDVCAALKDFKLEICHGRYGLSSKNTTPNDIYDIYKMLDNDLKKSFVVGITDDITKLSLVHYEKNFVTNYKELHIYGFGSDGMVSASKDILKILGTNQYVQGYFEYDSKKSGGVTISHLRLAKKLIKAPYYVTHPKIVVVSKDEYFHKFKMLDNIEENGILVVNTDKNQERFNKFISSSDKARLLQKKINVYLIDASSLATKYGISGKISLIMEAVILNLLNIKDYENLLIQKIKERFYTKGANIVNANVNSVKESKYLLNKIIIDHQETFDLKVKNDFLDIVNSRLGGNLTTKDVYNFRDGAMHGGTSAFEKRNMSLLCAKWNKDKCIECGMCSMVCPHAVIRPFILDKKNNHSEYAKDEINGKNKFMISISEEDCTGCGLCLEICPTKCLTFGEKDKKLQKVANDLFNNYENPKTEVSNIKTSQLQKPLFEFSGACAGCGETPYIKLLTQVVGEKLVIANATGCSSIYGASCPSMPYKVSWGNSLFEDNAEYGYGLLLSYENLRNRVLEQLKNNKKADKYYKFVKNNFNDYQKIKSKKTEIEKFVSKDLRDFITPKSVWTIGGDGWAYDIGFGGLDHVLSSNKNAKILVLDTEVYSNTGGQSSKSTHIGAVAEFANLGKRTYKKDLFKLAMNYPNVYVASISLGANMMQAINVFKEAEAHEGPAIVIAYSPCIEQGIFGGMKNSILEEKKAVECGYVLLMRYNNGVLSMDSSEPNFDKYIDFLEQEVRYSALEIKDKKLAKDLFQKNKEYSINRYSYYKNLINK